MGWVYTRADTLLASRAVLRLSDPAENKFGPVKGCDGTEAGRNIEFQFPPKITGDNRKGNWAEEDLRGKEPISVFATSGPREITMTWTYVVDSFDKINGAWTIDRITKNIRNLRGYFPRVRNPKSSRENLIIEFYIWCIGGKRKIAARIKAVNVKYGETMVFPPNWSTKGFPLRTDITIDVRLWTKGGIKDEEDQDVLKLKDLTPDWF